MFYKKIKSLIKIIRYKVYEFLKIISLSSVSFLLNH
uniref:Uncharacterized protein n=1 Tax=Membranoptera weeksiae TaxID=158720 RepID=A0A1L1WEK9_9FLOR|nr:hypothetical protein [Membranoptera weeksiae]AIC36833.1 hypothetical protein [Membranoptera weeksiae]